MSAIKIFLKSLTLQAQAQEMHAHIRPNATCLYFPCKFNQANDDAINHERLKNVIRDFEQDLWSNLQRMCHIQAAHRGKTNFSKEVHQYGQLKNKAC